MSKIRAVVVDPDAPNRRALDKGGEIARRLIERGYTGKAVLRVGPN
jgi:hypothetical protein